MPFRVRHPGPDRGPNGPTDPKRSDHPAAPFSRVIGIGENPALWAIPLGRWSGVSVALHALFPIWAAAEALGAVPHSGLGPLYVAPCILAFLLIATTRELARVWWARRLGSLRRHVVIWPLGGLAPSPTPRPTEGPWSECGGLLFHLALLPLLAGALWAFGAGWHDLAPNLFAPTRSLVNVRSHAEIFVFWLYYANLVILLLNALLPMPPFDAARLLHHRRARRGAPAQAAAASLRLGLFTALALFIAAAVAGQQRLMAVAVLGALAAWLEFRMTLFPLHPFTPDSPSTPSTPQPHAPQPVASPPTTPPEAAAAPPPPSTAQLDTILAKISREGLASLTPDERETLRLATERSRDEPGARNAPKVRDAG